MLFEALDRIKRNIIMGAIALMFAGTVLLLTQGAYVRFLGSVLAFALAVRSVMSMLDFAASAKSLMDCIRLIAGLAAGIAAVALFTYDGLFEAFFSWLIGTVPILTGGYGLYHALAYARRSGRRGWWVLVVLSGSLMVIGGTAFWNPWTGESEAAMRVVGAILVYSAVVSALSLVWIWPVRGESEV